MRSSGNEFIIYRNEEFSLDKEIVNKDDSPYIISNKFESPHFLITIGSSKHIQNSQYVKKIYLPLDDVPKFYCTNPINLLDLKNENGESLYKDGYPLDLTLENVDGVNIFMSAYYNDEQIGFELNDAVFYFESKNGITYKYWKPDSTAEGSSGKWIDYKLRIVYTFSSFLTRQWVSQTYYYSIDLVSGRSLDDYISDVCYENSLLRGETEDTLASLKTLGLVPESLTVDDLIARIDASYSILGPSKISVLSSIGGKI